MGTLFEGGVYSRHYSIDNVVPTEVNCHRNEVFALFLYYFCIIWYACTISPILVMIIKNRRPFFGTNRRKAETELFVFEGVRLRFEF